MVQQEIKEKKRHPIAEGVTNYLLMETSGALLITGDWGCGKTYYFKHELFEEIKELIKEKSFIPVIISLFGLTELKEIPERILFAYLDQNGTSFGKVTKTAKNIAEALPIIKDYVNVDKLLGSGQGLYKIIPNNVLICLDDIERVTKAININDILGAINELVENKNYKVIIIANESFIESDKLLFKEKVIEKTFRFLPDIINIFSLLVDSHENSCFSEFMLQEAIISSIDPQNKSVKGFINGELKKSLSNIRILKFAIEHFYPVFMHYIKKTNPKEQINDITIKKLRSYWVFILSVSIEYKNNNLSFEDKHGIDSYQEIANTSDSEYIASLKKKEEVNEEKTIQDKSRTDAQYTQKFFKKYFLRLSEAPFFFTELYNYITAGIAIDFCALDDYTNPKFSSADDVINPAHKLLAEFMREGYWKFTNEQIPIELQKLLDYAQEGLFDEYMGYINASIYLITFQNIFNQSEDSIIAKIKEGIDKFTERVEINYITKMHIQIIHEQLNPCVIPVYEYIMTSIDRKLDMDFKKEADEMQSLFQTDIKQLLLKLLPEKYNIASQYIDIPIFKNINKEIIENKINNIEPNEAMCLRNLIEQRYNKIQPIIKLKEEIPFLKSLRESIKNIDFEEKKMSNLILKELSPILEETITRLEASD